MRRKRRLMARIPFLAIFVFLLCLVPGAAVLTWDAGLWGRHAAPAAAPVEVARSATPDSGRNLAREWAEAVARDKAVRADTLLLLYPRAKRAYYDKYNQGFITLGPPDPGGEPVGDYTESPGSGGSTVICWGAEGGSYYVPDPLDPTQTHYEMEPGWKVVEAANGETVIQVS